MQSSFSELEYAAKKRVTRRDRFLAEYVGRDLRLKVIECVPDEGRIVFSERAARADAYATRSRGALFGSEPVCNICRVLRFSARRRHTWPPNGVHRRAWRCVRGARGGHNPGLQRCQHFCERDGKRADPQLAGDIRQFDNAFHFALSPA